MQAKLLRFIQDGEFERLGSSHTIKVDTRIIAATNRNLEEEVARGNFRSDLFYRLNVIAIHLPALRERRDDIPLLAEAFLARSAEGRGTEPKVLSADALAIGRGKQETKDGYAEKLRNPKELVRLATGKVSLRKLAGGLKRAVSPAPPPTSLAQEMAIALARFDMCVAGSTPGGVVPTQMPSTLSVGSKRKRVS